MGKFASFIIMIFLCISGARASDLNGSIIDLAPWGYLDQDQKIQGLHKEILDEISTRTGLKISYNLKPLARFVNDVETHKTDFGMLIMRDKFRDSVDDLYTIQNLSQYIVYAKGLSAEQIHHPLNITFLRGELTIPPEAFSALGIDLDVVRKLEVTSYDQAFRMLIAQRTDAVVFTAGAFKHYLQSSNLSQSDFGAVQLLHGKNVSFFMPKNARGYSPKTARIIKETLNDMWNDNTLHKINTRQTHLW